MKHYYIKSHFVLRLLLCAVLFCPLAAFAQTETETTPLTPVIYLEENTDDPTTYTATFEALKEAPASSSYVKRGEGYYSLDLAKYNSPINYDRSSITKVIIDSSMKDLKPTSTAKWFSNWGG